MCDGCNADDEQGHSGLEGECKIASFIQRARNAYVYGDLEIDANPRVSRTGPSTPDDEAGVWVAAWVFVGKEDLEEMND